MERVLRDLGQCGCPGWDLICKQTQQHLFPEKGNVGRPQSAWAQLKNIRLFERKIGAKKKNLKENIPPPPRRGIQSQREQTGSHTRAYYLKRPVLCSCNLYTHIFGKISTSPPTQMGLKSSLNHERSLAGLWNCYPLRQKDELRKMILIRFVDVQGNIFHSGF